MNGWNRLFVVIAVGWAIVSPFLVAREANRAPELTFYSCADSAYREYGSSDSPLFNMNRYIAETNACSQAYVRDGVRVPRVLRAMVGTDDRILGLAGWGFMLIPLALLWIVSWGIGRIVIWIAAGFRRLLGYQNGVTH